MSARLQQWKERRAPRELTLSDGLTVLIRPVRIENLVLNGKVPITLVREMQKVQTDADGRYRDEDALRLTDVIDAVVMAAVVDPCVTRDGGEDSIALDDILYTDRVRIFEEVNAPAAALQSFREQPDGDGADAPGGEDLRPEAE